MPNSLDLHYVTSLEEIVWGGSLVAVTMAMHVFGMFVILRLLDVMKQRFETRFATVRGMILLLLTSWMILLVHLLEVFVWAGFFYWQGALNSPNASPSLCYYFSLNAYTTVGSTYTLVARWRLLEGMISMAGMMTLAWSTVVLLSLIQNSQQHAGRLSVQKAQSRADGPTAPR